MAAATAGEVQTSAYSQLNAQLNSASGFLATLSALINIAQPDIDPIPEPDYSANANLYNLFVIQPPLFSGGVISVPLPTAPTLTFDPVGSVTVPEFAGSLPAVNITSAPDITLPTLPTQPSLVDVALPSAPTITMPVAPNVGTINIPLPPAISIPSFTASLPAEDFLTPSNTFSFAEQPYQDALLDELKVKLMDDLVNGGYGIETSDEADLWNRAREREVDTTLMDIDEAFRFAGARGFPLPPGDTAVLVQRSLQKAQDKISSISRDIAIKRADMFVENRKFTITEVRALETILINYWNSVQERSLNAQKATLDAAIAIYETQIKRYNARLDAYRTEAQVFEAKIRAVATQIEIFRTQIQAKQVEADIQRILVETFNAQLKGVELTVDIFKTQMEAANIQSQIQRTKIEAYRALIDAYTAQVQSEVAKQNAYEAKIKGELAKVQVFETQARAYSATVDGLKAKSEVLIGQARAQWEQARAKVDAYRGQLEGADIMLKSQTAVVNANVTTYQARIQQYVAQLNALAEQFRLDETSIQNAREINVKNSEIGIQGADLRLKRALGTLEIQAKGLQIGGDYYKNLIAAIAGTIQSIATVSS